MEKMPYNLAEMLRNAEGRSRMMDDSHSHNRGCINTNFCMSSPPDMNSGILTMAFVDMQPMESVYPPETALQRGTLFPDIDKPFMGGMVR